MSRTAAAKCRAPAAGRGDRPPDVPRASARALDARHLAGRRLRRGRARPARRPGGRGRRHPRSQAHPARPQRFQEAHRRRSARGSTTRSAPRAEVAVAFGSTARIDRDNILRPRCGRWRARCGRCRCGRKLVFVDGRDRIDVGCDCEAVISRRRAGALDRGGLDRRQGDARPADDAARRRASRATASSATWATACPSISRR